MNYEIIIERGTQRNNMSYEHFAIDADPETTVLYVLEQLNLRTPLRTIEGKTTEKIGWECNCRQAMCGACAMIINGYPKLACKAFLKDLRNPITLQPFQKFPLVRDLIVDKSSLQKNMTEMKLWISDAKTVENKLNESLHLAATCIQCGCCLEACPNYSGFDKFYGAISMNYEYIITSQESDKAKRKDDLKETNKHFIGGCSNSFACEEVCPMHVPLTSHISRLNAATWKR